MAYSREEIIQALDIAKRQNNVEAISVLTEALQADEVYQANLSPLRRLELSQLKAAESKNKKFNPFADIVGGFGSGVVGYAETGAKGAIIPLEEDAELRARDAITNVADKLRPEFGDPTSHLYEFSSGLGSFAAIPASVAAGAGIGTLIGGPVGGIVGAGVGALGSALLPASGEASERARARGATQEERNLASLKALPVGALELVAPARIFKYFSKFNVPVLDKIEKRFGKGQSERWRDKVGDALVSGGVEGTQEATTAILQNMIEQGYNPEAELLDAGVAKDALIGAEVGTFVDLFSQVFLKGGKAGRYAQLRAEQEKQRKGQVDTKTDAPVTPPQEFDDDDAAPVNAELEQYASTERVPLEFANRVFAYAEKNNVSRDEAREAIEAEDAAKEPVKPPTKLNPVVGEKLPYPQSFKYIKDNLDQVVEEKGVRIGKDKDGNPVIKPFSKGQQDYVDKQLEKRALAEGQDADADAKVGQDKFRADLRKQQEKEDAVIDKRVDTTTTGKSVPSDTGGVGDATKAGVTTESATGTVTGAVGGTDTNVDRTDGSKGRADATLTSYKTFGQKATSDRAKAGIGALTKAEEKIEAGKATLVPAATPKGRIPLDTVGLKPLGELRQELIKKDQDELVSTRSMAGQKAPSKKQLDDKANYYDTAAGIQKLLTEANNRGIKITKQDRLRITKGKIFSKPKKRSPVITTPFNETQLAEIQALQGKLPDEKGRATLDLERDAQNVEAETYVKNYEKRMLLGLQNVIPNSQDPTSRKDILALRDLQQRPLEKQKPAKKRKGESDADFKKRRADWSMTKAAKAYFDNPNRIVDNILSMEGDVVNFETGEGQGKKVVADIKKDPKPEAIAKLEADQSYENALLAREWADQNLSPALKQFRQTQYQRLTDSYTTQPPKGSEQLAREKTVENAKKTVKKLDAIRSAKENNRLRKEKGLKGQPIQVKIDEGERVAPEIIKKANRILREAEETRKFNNLSLSEQLGVLDLIADNARVTGQVIESARDLFAKAAETTETEVGQVTKGAEPTGTQQVDALSADIEGDSAYIAQEVAENFSSHEDALDVQAIVGDGITVDSSAIDIFIDNTEPEISEKVSTVLEAYMADGDKAKLKKGLKDAYKLAVRMDKEGSLFAADAEMINNLKLSINKQIDVLVNNLGSVPIVMYNNGEATGNFTAEQIEVFENSQKKNVSRQRAKARRRMTESFARYIGADPKREDRFKRKSKASQERQKERYFKGLMDESPSLKRIMTSDQQTAGQFQPSGDGVIIINQSVDGGLNLHTVLHEMTHAGTLNTINDPNSKLGKEFRELYKAAKEADNAGPLFSGYGLTNPDEFAAEIFNNQEFIDEITQVYLQAKPNGKVEPLSLWQKIANWFGKWFNRRPIYIEADGSYNGAKLAERANLLVLSMLRPHTDTTTLDQITAVDISKPQSVDKILGRSFYSRKQPPLTRKQQTSFIDKTSELFKEEGPEWVKDKMASILPSKAMSEAASNVYKPLGDLYTEAHQTFELQRGDLKRMDDNVTSSVELVDSYTKTLTNEQVDELHNLMDDATRVYRVDPTANINEYSKFWLAYRQHSGNNAPIIRKSFDTAKDRDAAIEARNKKFPDNKAWNDGDLDQAKIDIFPELQARYKALPKNAKLAYKEVERLYESMFQQLQEKLFGDIDSDTTIDPATGRKIKNDLFAKLFASTTLKPYFPLDREGKYKIRYELSPDRHSELDQIQTVMVDTKAEVDRLLAVLNKDPDVVGDPKVSLVKDSIKDLEKVPPTKFVRETLEYLKEAKVDPEVSQKILTLYIDALPESSYAKSLRQRAGIGGASKDQTGYVLSKKARDLGRQIVRIEYGAKLHKLKARLDEMDKSGQIPEATGKTAKALTSKDVIVKDLDERINFAINPTSANWSMVANRLAFLYTIGFNVSSAVVNLSQIPLVVLPYMTARYGLKNTMRAYKDANVLLINSGVSKGGRTIAGTEVDGRSYTPELIKYFRVNKEGELELNEDKFKDIVGRTDKLKEQVAEMQPLVQLAYERGQLNESHLSDSLTLKEDGSRKTFMDKATTVSAWFFHNGEQLNRQTAMTMAYLLEVRAKKETLGRDTLTDAEMESAAQRALSQTQDTNAGSVIETGPRMSQNQFGRVALMYKPYGIQMYYTMIKSARQLLKNMFPGNDVVSRTQRNMAFKELAGVHLTSILFAGARGIPMYGAIKMLFNMFADDDEEDFDIVVRKKIGEELYKGGMTWLTGVDVSQRIALSQLIFNANRYNPDASFEETLFYVLGGPAGSVFKGYERAYKDFRNGQYERAFEAAIPTAFRNMYKSTVRYPRDEGMLTRRGDPIYSDISKGELVGQFVGFTPKEYTERQEINMAGKRIDESIRKQRSSLTKRFYIALTGDDGAEAGNVLDEIVKFNDKHPEAFISLATIKRSNKMHTKISMTMHNGITISNNYKYGMAELQSGIDQGFNLGLGEWLSSAMR